MRFAIVGPGRAGGAFTKALTHIGWQHTGSFGRGDDLALAALGADAILVCVPDGAVAAVASSVQPGDAAVIHVAGSLGLDVLAGHDRIGSLHPLMTLPDPDRGAARLLDNCWFAVAGDPIATTIAEALGGRPFAVADDHRMRYHAAAAVASNHLVALAAQVERLAIAAGIPAAAYWPLMSASMANVAETDPATALTGPAARADWDTLRGHRAALQDVSDAEATLYLTMATEAAHLAGHQLPEDLQ